MEITNLQDSMTSVQYQEYYTKVLPVFKWWYNQNEEGFRPVVIGRNLAWWLERGETIRKCKYICKDKDGKVICPHSEDSSQILSNSKGEKLSCWVCKYNPKKEMAGPFERFLVFNTKVLYTIDDIIARPAMLKTARSFYWHPAMHPWSEKGHGIKKQWDEIVGLNLVIDVDIIDKSERTIFEEDIYSTIPYMLDDIDEILKREDIDYKLQFSGNGIYFITSKIAVEEEKEKGEKEKDQTIEQFWNVIAGGWSKFITDDLKPLERKNWNFTFDAREPYTMQFVKTPFSLHQRLDVSAIPLNRDIFDDYTADEFKDLTSPEYVVNHIKELCDIWKVKV